ncbi:MAG: hypothetical protein JEZ09_16325 [Salinivirgaceae bacterium]|nr:hypothetical protein [Salinivirgaceae bacterium]
MKQLTKLSSVAIGLFAIVLFSSCSSHSKKDSDTDDSVLTEIKKDQIAENVKEFVYPLPTAFEVSEMLNRIGASFIFSLSNPAENVSKYFTEKSKALNLGIMGADLSYATTYKQKQIAMDYMKATNKLIDELGFASAIDSDLPEKIEMVENDKDQMVKLITKTFYDTYEYLNKNGRGSVSVMIVAGSWIEALYISTHISEDTYNNVEMIKIIMEQRESLNKLMGLINDHKSFSDVDSLGITLKPLHEVFNSLEDGGITQQQMEAISTEVAKVRAEMVK